MGAIDNRFVKKSKYQKHLNNDTCQCQICEQKCIIKNGSTGFCETRRNIDGEIYTLIYGCIPAASCNPIEKKPLYNFYPGTTAYTVGSYGCNFSCFWCQNHSLSHPRPSVTEMIEHCKDFLSPEDFIKKTLENNCEGTSISFNEPTLLFEYALDAFKLARKEDLYNTYVSNGYMTEKVLMDLIEYGLDAINIDIKGSREMVKMYCGADVEKVWRNARLCVEHGVHVEITTLLIEGLNSDEKTIRSIARRIKNELGESIPFHLTRAFPRFKSNQHGLSEPTLLKTLYKGLLIAQKEGLKMVYLGNI